MRRSLTWLAVLLGLLAMSGCTVIFSGTVSASNRREPSADELRERCRAAEREARGQQRTPPRCQTRPVEKTSVATGVLVGALFDLVVIAAVAASLPPND